MSPLGPRTRTRSPLSSLRCRGPLRSSTAALFFCKYAPAVKERTNICQEEEEAEFRYSSRRSPAASFSASGRGPGDQQAGAVGADSDEQRETCWQLGPDGLGCCWDRCCRRFSPPLDRAAGASSSPNPPLGNGALTPVSLCCNHLSFFACFFLPSFSLEFIRGSEMLTGSKTTFKVRQMLPDMKVSWPRLTMLASVEGAPTYFILYSLIVQHIWTH